MGEMHRLRRLLRLYDKSSRKFRRSESARADSLQTLARRTSETGPAGESGATLESRSPGESEAAGTPGAAVESGAAIEPEAAGESGDFRPVDPEWIDIPNLQTWLSICDNQHGSECRPSPYSRVHPSLPPQWLVDVSVGCLVAAKSDYRYLALSYVWGNVKTLKTTQTNLASLLTEGSLFRDDLDPPIPRTIRDVMQLTKLLDERYLWVDSLCIVQDIDSDTKHLQLDSMASIYNDAYVTIVAANGWDADHGLRGIKGVTGPRHYSSHNQSDFFESLQPRSSIWYSRGWTLQEQLFSRRVIMFQYQLAVWECQCCTWHEALAPHALRRQQPKGIDIFRISEWPEGSKLSFWPNLRQYASFVNNYSIRKLSFSEDVYAAFAGITSTLTRTFSGGFLYGLPEMFFDVALLWQPAHHSERRQLQVSGESNSRRFPSWSWMGWVGAFDARSWESGYEYIYLADGVYVDSTSSTEATVPWFTSDEDFPNKRPIIPSYRDFKKCGDDPAVKLPHHWFAFETGDGYNPFLSTCPEYLFAHEWSRSTGFRYPIATISEGQPSMPGPQTQFIHCRTRRSTAFSGDKYRVNNEDRLSLIHHSDCTLPVLPLVDAENSLAGALRLNVPAGYSGSDLPQNFELIELSSGHETDDTRGCVPIYRPLVPTSLGKYEFYNVMWIRWEDGIAYREAVGRVLRHAWEKNATEWTDVTLG